MKIGEASQLTGLPIDTIRYYEKRGLITEPERRYSGYRVFEKQQIDELRFIKRAHELGFTLGEIKDLLNLRVDDRADCSKVKRKAEEKYQHVTDKIRDLERIRDVLVDLIDSCAGGHVPADQCPILKAMEPGGNNGMVE
ncbi:MAG TPA: MerR family transcriptional regulator [Bacteroidales bacterium]|nr:MerR family transcriptional regulator [Bacteroidales bacterium]